MYRCCPSLVCGFKMVQDCSCISASVKARDVFCGIVRVACWCIWRARNNLRFKNKQVKVADIISEIKSLGFLRICNM
ncbi:hypothetical protein Hanom_Chr10g00917111 [Helianthus anomalus]